MASDESLAARIRDTLARKTSRGRSIAGILPKLFSNSRPTR